LKRTLKGIAAASVVLGTLASPVSVFASTTHYNTTKVAHEYATALKSITVTKTESFTVTIKDSHNKAISGALVSFSSSNTSVATVSSSHVVTNKNGQATVVIKGHKAGSATLKVTVNGKSYSYKVTVTQPAAPTVSISGLSDGQIVASASHTVTVKSNEKSVSLYLNGKRQSGNGPTFHLTLAQGTNTITAEAANEIGQVAKKTIHVTLGKLAITGAPTSSIGIGKKVTLGLTDADKAVTSGVTWSVDGDGGAVIDQKGNFIASEAGTYTVTATYDGQKATAKVVVYGEAAGVKLSAASSTVVANGQSTVTITATVVDANGTPVPNYNGPVKAYLITGGSDTLTTADGNKDAGSLANPNTYTAKNGVVTITLNASTTVGNDVVYAGIPDSDGNVSSWASTTIKAVAPVATYVEVSAPKKANSETTSSTGVPVTITVTDQDHKALSSGSYVATVTLSGPGKFDDGTQTKTLALGPTGTVTVYPNQTNTSGVITVSASVNGLTSVPAQIQAYVPGMATKLGLSTAPTTTTFTADDVAKGDATTPFLSLPVESEDSAGSATSKSAPSKVSVQVLYNGAPSTAIGVYDGSQFKDTSTPVDVSEDVSGSGSYTVKLGYVSTSPTIPAGTYTVTVKGDGVGTLTQQFTVKAGKPYTVAVTPASGAAYDVAESNPTATITAQVKDRYGNDVAQSGIVVDFTAGGTNLPTLSASQVATNSAGVATITATEPAVAGDEGKVHAVIDSTYATNNGLSVDSTGVDSADLTVTESVASTISATANYGGSATSFTAGNDDNFSFVVKDAAGHTVTGDTLSYTITGPGNTNISDTTSSSTLTLSGTKVLKTAGAYTLKVTDVSSPNHPSTTVSFNVTPDAFNGFDFFQGSNDLSVNGLNLAAGQSTTVTVLPVDEYHNVVTAPGDFSVTLPTDDTDVSFSSSKVTVAGSTGGTVTIFANGASTGTLPASDFAINTYAPVATRAVFSASAKYDYSGDTSGPASNTKIPFVVTVKDTNGKALANQTVTLSLESTPVGTFDGGKTTITVTTDANGQAAFTYVTGTGTHKVDMDTITATMPTSAAPGTASLGSVQVSY
jgi:hypothetical protein